MSHTHTQSLTFIPEGELATLALSAGTAGCHKHKKSKVIYYSQL